MHTPARDPNVFLELYTLIESSKTKNTLVRYGPLDGSESKKNIKPQVHLLGRRAVQILDRPARKTYIAGIILQKNFTGFYFMPMYSHPKKFPLKSPLLKKYRKGKSCINMKSVDPRSLRELASLMKKGIALYKKEGWI